jgi:hypothetical protein
LKAWVLEVRRRAALADRRDIADQYIGRLLAHAMADKIDGFWPDRAVRQVLEECASEQMERGLAIERFNMRGVYSKAVFEGGNQERELASQYREWAKGVVAWPRTSATLERIATTWDREAVQADVRAEQDQMRY